MYEIYYDIKSDDYHLRTEISSSALKRVLISPAHYQAYLAEKIEPTPAQILGTCVHSAILEQDYSKYICAPDVRRNTKAWDSFCEENPGKLPLKQDDYNTVKEMFNAFYAHPMASKLIAKGKPEVSIIGTHEETGLKIKGRLDFLADVNDDLYIVDYKTASSAQPNDFKRQIFDFGYQISVAHYKSMAEKALGRNIKDVFFVVQEKSAPYAIRIFRASDNMLEMGLHLRDKGLYTIKQCQEKNEWPGYEPKVEEIELTSWHYEAMNNV